VDFEQQRVYVAGHQGMVGAAVVRRLQALGAQQIVTRSRSELDLTRQSAVEAFFASEPLDVVVVAAAKVGGIYANNTYPADFLYDNLALEMNVIHAAFQAGVRRLLFLGSSCIYPRLAPQPITEDSLLTSALEPTNEAYALAKIAGLKYCQYLRRQHGVCFHSAMPTNLYGPRDNYHPQHSHVLPALIRRFHEAAVAGADEVVIWGTGTPRREFLHVDDLADALCHLLALDNPPDWINVGFGDDIAIADLARLVATVTGFRGRITQDTSKPDGTPRKLMDPSQLRALGWQPSINLEAGIRHAYADFLQATGAHRLRAV
jgi:GDP-L-fucose synthase